MKGKNEKGVFQGSQDRYEQGLRPYEENILFRGFKDFEVLTVRSPGLYCSVARSPERSEPLIPSMADDDTTVRTRASFLKVLSFR
jgi:hypothetical protein